MNETYISFYLRTNRIHIFVDALRALGCPRFICLMIQEDGSSIAIIPYKKKDFRSHRVPSDVYVGTSGMEASSIKLCRIVSELHQWEDDCSYRVPGFVLHNPKVAFFDLRRADIIKA